MRKAILASIFVLIHVGILACDCDPDPGLTSSFENYELIFRGVVKDTLIKEREGTAVFTVLKIFKGQIGKEMAVRYDATGDCLMSFAPGEEWIIYVNFDQYKRANVHFCGHSRKKFLNASEDFLLPSRKISFEGEDSLLTSFFKPDTLSPLSKEGEMKQRELQHPERGTAIWYILGALPIFVILWFILKKYLR